MTESSTADAMRGAVRRGDAATVRALLEGHNELRALVNEPLFPFDSPALVHFAARDDVAMIEVLLEFGADPNRRSSWWAGGFHPLHGASPAAAERLLAAGAIPDACAAAHLDRADLLTAIITADPARVHERGGDGKTPLHFAASRRIVDLLLEAGADPDARDVDHRSTPAQWMLDRRRGAGRYDLAGYLVERGATADIFLAAALGLGDRVRALLDADPSLLELRTTRGGYSEKPPSSFHIYMWTIGADRSPLQVAGQFEQPAVIDLIRAAATPRQLLIAALADGDAEEARARLGSQPDLLGTLTPADQGMLPEAGWAGNAAAVELLLELGFDPRTPGQDGGTVLHCAAWQGSAECVAAVLRHADAASLLERRDPTHHATPLGWCSHGSCYGPRADHAGVARLLLDAGARLDADPEDASDAVRAVIAKWRARA